MQLFKHARANKRGIGGLNENATGFVVTTIILVIGLTLLGSLQDTQVENSTEFNATASGLSALEVFTDNLGLLALVIVFGVIIFFVVRFLATRGGS